MSVCPWCVHGDPCGCMCHRAFCAVCGVEISVVTLPPDWDASVPIMCGMGCEPSKDSERGADRAGSHARNKP